MRFSRMTVQTTNKDLRTLERSIRNFILKNNYDAFSKESIDWFRNYITQNFRKNSFKTAFAAGTHTLKPKPGFLYTYQYDAKHKDTLPYWDMFPLILCFDITKDGWYGISLHYLAPKIRASIFLELLDTLNKPGYDEKTRFKITWAKLKVMSQNKYIKHACKRYLTGQLVTPMCKIDPRYWEPVLFMPYAKFVGATQKDVWKDI